MKHCSTKEQIIESKLRENSLYISTREEPETFKFLKSKTSVAMVCQQDLTRDSRPLLDRKIMQALDYQGSISDNRILKALSRLNGEQSAYLTLALFLYLMDEVSRQPNAQNLSFLTAATMCGLDDPDLIDLRQIKMRLVNTLRTLGLFSTEMRAIIGTWCSSASGFKIGEFKQDRVETNIPDVYESVGAYVKLAEKICCLNPDDPYMQISRCVAVALGRKQYMLNFRDSPKEAYHDVEKLLKHPEILWQFDRQGTATRRARLLDVIKQEYKALVPKPLSLVKKSFFRKFLNVPPVDVMRILHAENYAIVLTEGHNFADVLQERPDLRGNSAKTFNLIRTKCDGVRFGTFKTIVIALHARIHEITDQQILFATQTLCHESVHVAFGVMKIRNNQELHGRLDSDYRFTGETKGEILQLKDDIYAFFKTMSLEEYQEFRKIKRKCNLPLANYIDPETVGIEANYDLQDGKYFPNDGMEEALASLYSAWSTEREIFYGDNQHLPKLRDIAERLDCTMHKIANELAGHVQQERRDIKPKANIVPQPRRLFPASASTLEQTGLRA